MELRSDQLAITFDGRAAGPAGLINRLTGEDYGVHDEGFVVEADEFTIDSRACAPAALVCEGSVASAAYAGPDARVDVRYEPRGHFVEKRILVTPTRACCVRRVVVARLDLRVPRLIAVVPYRFQRNVTYFARTRRGGLFAGLETPFDASGLDGDRVTLGYRPDLRLRAGETLDCPPAYLGVYPRAAGEERGRGFPADADVVGHLLEGTFHDLPLPSESDAMVAMVEAVLGPSRHGPTTALSPVCAGGVPLGPTDGAWLASDAEQARMREILDFAAECGVQYVQDYLPWGGEPRKISGAVAAAQATPHPWALALLDRARKRGLTPLLWGTFSNVFPWTTPGESPSFRGNRADWLVAPPEPMPFPGNCIGSGAYRAWLTPFTLAWMRANGHRGFSIDGDFIGSGGWYTTTAHPTRCLSDAHDHAPGLAEHACQRGLAAHLADVRRSLPDAFLWLMRPFMDLGVWTYRHGDAVFTILETATLDNLTGIAGQPPNVTFGDKVRRWARMRRQWHFCPHYLDQAQLFAGVDGSGRVDMPWFSEALDYVLLSALSTTPNLCLFSGPVARIPAADRATIRRWVDWARAHREHMLVRKDLPAWPAAGVVDGSAHVVGDRGFVFLFNPNPEPRPAQFAMSDADLGLRAPKGARFELAPIHPAGGSPRHAAAGSDVDWEVPGFTALLLEIRPAGGG